MRRPPGPDPGKTPPAGGLRLLGGGRPSHSGVRRADATPPAARTTHLPDSGAALAPGTTAVSGEVSVEIPADAELAIDTLTCATAGQQALRTQSIAVAVASALLASAPAGGEFGLVHGLAPAAAICSPAKVTVALPHARGQPNDPGWAPGTAVELDLRAQRRLGQGERRRGQRRRPERLDRRRPGFPFLEPFAVRGKVNQGRRGQPISLSLSIRTQTATGKVARSGSHRSSVAADLTGPAPPAGLQGHGALRFEIDPWPRVEGRAPQRGPSPLRRRSAAPASDKAQRPDVHGALARHRGGLPRGARPPS